jgi:tetratricopeptide (TPR) repeat protein
VVDSEDNTGDWILKHPQYTGWKSQETSTLLWIQGKPGSGKSVLMKHLLRELRKERSHRNLVASFFYSARDGERETSHQHMLQTLLFQVLEQEGQLYPRFQETYRRLRGASKDQITWTYDDLKEVFAALATSHEQSLQIYLIVDAIDESDKGQLSDILSLFHDRHRSSSPTSVIKTILASRPSELIEKKLTGSFNLLLEEENKNDIAVLVDAKLAFLHDSDDTLFQWAVKYLNDHSHGVFLWISIIIKELIIWADEGGYTEAEIKGKVQTFPLELVDYYKYMIKRLAQHKPEVQDEARKMLDWVTYAERPITACEFWDIIAVPSNLDRSYVASIQDFQALKLRRLQDVRKRIQKNCGDLIEIKRQNLFSKPTDDSEHLELNPRDVIQLFHQTVREFLTRLDKVAEPFHIVEANAHNTIAIVCTRYIRLSLAVDDNRIEGSTWPLDVGSWTTDDHSRLVGHLKHQSLLSYALKYLTRHLSSIKRSESAVWQGLEDYFNQTREAADSYAWNILQLWFETIGFPTEISESATQFRIASLVAAINLETLSVVQAFLETQPTLDHVDRHTNHTALQTAAALGNHDMADLLIDRGASVNFHGGYFGTSLQAAAYHGHSDVVQMLLNGGADPNAEGGFLRTAFLAAACMGHVDVAAELLGRGADTYAPPDLLRVFSDLGQAEKIGKPLISTLKTLLGTTHNSTISASILVARAYENHELWKEAEDLFVPVVETNKEMLGRTHPYTLESINGLALIYWKQERWKEAEALLKEVVKTRQSTLGRQHPDTLVNMANLAFIYQKQERWKEAEALLEVVIKTRQSGLERQHPDTLVSMTNLAFTYWKQERWKEAEALLEVVIKTRQSGLERQHPDTLVSMTNLAFIYQKQERWKEAEDLLAQSTSSRDEKNST